MYFYNEKGQKIYVYINTNQQGLTGPSGATGGYKFDPVVNPYDDRDYADYGDKGKCKKKYKHKKKCNTMEQGLYVMLIIIFIFITYCLIKGSKKKEL